MRRATPSHEYRDEYAIVLREASSIPFHATRLRTSRDGATTHLNVVGFRNGRIFDATWAVACALQVPFTRTNTQPGSVTASSGGTNPVTDLQDRLERALGVPVQVHES